MGTSLRPAPLTSAELALAVRGLHVADLALALACQAGDRAALSLLAFYAGWPNAKSAVAKAREVLPAK
jgi:alkylhydroperoxidase/carboxymuconolactone decarboxylase family protein YurZ